jgi:murein DD-endopeptidase MepM/ murein hydrolase activator NlpD
MKNLLILSIFLVVVGLRSEVPPNRFQVEMNRIRDAFNSGNLDAIQNDFSSEMLKAIPFEDIKKSLQEFSKQYGKIQKIEEPLFKTRILVVFVTRFERNSLETNLSLDSGGKIIGLQFLPHTDVASKNLTELRLPFEHEWLVFWGGDTRDLNHHHDVPSQRFAFDFVMVDQKGKTFKNEGLRNEDYFAFDQEILAPADGIVTEVISGVRDCLPRVMNPFSAIGNAVFIQHSTNEVSVLAHLKLNSTQVKVGDQVKKGQVVGRGGNSGNSSEPHLHYHLQNSSTIQDANGVKCYFKTVLSIKNGQKQSHENYSPTKGELINP